MDGRRTLVVRPVMRDNPDRARQSDDTGGGAGQPSRESLSSPPSPSPGAAADAGAGAVAGDEHRPPIHSVSATAPAEEFEEVCTAVSQSVTRAMHAFLPSAPQD